MYNLDGFLEKHPGGPLMLEATRGEDATAAFESYHAMSDMSKIRRIMEKYEVETDHSISPMQTRFVDGEFYYVLRKEVSAYFKARGISHHANWFWVIKSIVQAALFFSSVAFFCFGDGYSIFARSLGAVFSGHMLSQNIGVMHDASHHTISSNPVVNELLAKLWNSLALWDNRIWYKHHCFRHHAFTGSHDDPDTIHARPLIRKSMFEPLSRYKIISTTFTYFAFILTIFPGMWFGQSLGYMRGIMKGRMWGFNLPRRPFDGLEFVIRIATLGCLACATRTSLTLPILFAISANFWYAVCVVPDHDTFETEQNMVRDISNTDWGEVQVRNSGNFSTDNPYFLNLLGGINYQIEHHLFPTICSVHLPEVAKIVKAACAEYKIPYVCHPTIASAYLSALKKFQYLAMDKPINEKLYEKCE